MVIRKNSDHWLLITQPAHAWISGQIAENWGGHGFVRPAPWKELCFAAARHDDGWAEREIYPVLNTETGLPYDFKNIPMEDHMSIWNQSAALSEYSSRFAALLVSRHIMGLFSMHDFSREPETVRLKADHFKSQQQALQQRLYADLESDSFYGAFIHDTNLEQHFRLLSVFDYLSLFLILGESEEVELDDIPALETRHSFKDDTLLESEPSYEDGSTKVRLSRRGSPAEGHATEYPETWRVSPWPFTSDVVQLRCDAILLKKRCAHQKELDRTMEQGKKVPFAAELIPGL